MPDPHYAATLAPAVVHPDRDCHVDHALRLRAYELWEKAGRPEGLDQMGKSWADHFWLLAEKEFHKRTASAENILRNPAMQMEATNAGIS